VFCPDLPFADPRAQYPPRRSHRMTPQSPVAPNSHLNASLPLGNRTARAIWSVAYALLVRLSPRPAHAWRAWVYRLFGATLGRDCHIYPGARVWAPWNLQCEDCVGIADEAVIYNTLPMKLGSHCVISQQAYLCGATHDFELEGFPMVSAPISIGRHAWICARAVVGPGVRVADGAVLGLASVTTRHLEAWTVYAGAPARPIRQRVMR
jgi:putative colanic acid biosynthesis acetyltransferase WcaF